MDIYLWGPSGAGKTWLLNALIRHINLMEIALRKDESPFDLWVEDVRDSRRVISSELESAATTDIDYVSYTLRRRYNIRDKNKHSEITALACTHDHQISMLDGPGDEITGEILLQANTEENRAKVLAANTRLKSAHYLVVIINEGNVDSRDGKQKTRSLIGKTFSEALQRLINLDRDPLQKVYLCFTKTDKYQGAAADVPSMLSRLFEKHSDRIEGQLRDLVNFRQGELPAYFLSAPGYYNDPLDNNKLKPNIVNTGVLADPTCWRPFQVSDPFFDIFDDGERKAILHMPIKPDIPGLSVLPQAFQERVKDKLVNAQRNELLNAHISYGKMVDPSKIRT